MVRGRVLLERFILDVWNEMCVRNLFEDFLGLCKVLVQDMYFELLVCGWILKVRDLIKLFKDYVQVGKIYLRIEL